MPLSDVLKTPKTSKRLVCAFGEDCIGPHPLCRAETARTCGVSIEDVPDPDLSHLSHRETDTYGEQFELL